MLYLILKKKWTMWPGMLNHFWTHNPLIAIQCWHVICIRETGLSCVLETHELWRWSETDSRGYKNNVMCTETSENFRTSWSILGFVMQGESKHRDATNYISPKFSLCLTKVDPSTFRKYTYSQMYKHIYIIYYILLNVVSMLSESIL